MKVREIQQHLQDSDFLRGNFARPGQEQGNLVMIWITSSCHNQAEQEGML